MKSFRGIIVGLGAGLSTIGLAGAADLAVKAKPVDYVKVCSLYGAGFYYVPGTDSCLKLGGYTRVDTTFNGQGPQEQPAWTSNSGQNNRLKNGYAGRARQVVNGDLRTATEYGVVRVYFQETFQWSTGDAVAGGVLGADFAFIQFAGFTMGKAASQFDAPWSGYPGNITTFLLGGADDVTGVNQFSYTANLGEGITATVSAQDQVAYYQSNLWNASLMTPSSFATGTYGGSDYAGTISPDFVGMLRVDQSWGLFQASVAAHDVHAAYNGAAETSGHPRDVWGWAAQLALSVRDIPTGIGDSVNLTVGYADGASRYIIGGSSPSTFSIYGGSGLPGVYQGLAAASPADGVFRGTSTADGTPIDTTKAWGVRGAFNHNWDLNWSSSLFGAYTSLSYGAAGRALICATAAGFSCNPDFNIAQIGTVTRWTPVKNLTFSGELMYTYLDQKNSGTIALPAINSKPAATYEFKDKGALVFGMRVQRNF